MNTVQIKLRLNPTKVLVILAGVIGFLILMGSIVALLLTFTHYKTVMGIVQLFDMDLERTITSYFSALDLGFAALLLGLIAYLKKDLADVYWRHWLGLAVGFVFLSVDEIVSIHELVIQLFRDHQVGADWPPHYMTAIIGCTAVAILLVPYSRFLWHLSPKDRVRFMLAGAVFIFGAFGAEALGGYVDTHPEVWSRGYYYTEIIIEESLEMIGIFLFIRALFFYIEDLASVSPMLKSMAGQAQPADYQAVYSDAIV